MADPYALMESVIRGTPEQCTDAMMAEVEGRSTWWQPHLVLRHRPGTPHDGPGCVVDAIATPRGHAGHRAASARWTMRLDGYVPGRLMRWTCIAGDYRGWIAEEFSPEGPFSTRIRVRGEIRPRGWTRLRLLVHDEVSARIRVLQAGFNGLEHYIAMAYRPVREPEVSGSSPES